MKEQSFAKLLRQSQFVKYDPKIPRVFTSSHLPPPGIINAEQQRDTTFKRPAFYGFKKDLHPTLYGKPYTAIRMIEQEDQFSGNCLFEDASGNSKLLLIMEELEHLLTSVGPGRAQVPGRFLGRQNNEGFAISVAGINALLPTAEVPPMLLFGPEHVQKHYWFYLLAAKWESKRQPQIVLTLKKS